MMIFNLIKKDILIVKKYVLIMFAAAVLIPPFMLWRAPEYTGILGFMLSVIFCVLMLLQYVSLKEYQFPKAATLLCATPFSRKMMVLSKYIFCIAVYIACCVIYAIETLLIPALGTVNVTMFFLMLFVTSLFIGVYLPLQYKIGKICICGCDNGFTIYFATAHENGKCEFELPFRIFSVACLRKCFSVFLDYFDCIGCFVYEVLW